MTKIALFLRIFQALLKHNYSKGILNKPSTFFLLQINFVKSLYISLIDQNVVIDKSFHEKCTNLKELAQFHFKTCLENHLFQKGGGSDSGRVENQEKDTVRCRSNNFTDLHSFNIINKRPQVAYTHVHAYMWAPVPQGNW